MLKLSRKPNETIIIGDIIIKVIKCRSGRVELGIDAPEHATILRGELLDDCESSVGGDHEELV